MQRDFHLNSINCLCLRKASRIVPANMIAAVIDSDLTMEEVMFAATAILIGVIGVIGAALVYRRFETPSDASGASLRQSVGMHGALVARRK